MPSYCIGGDQSTLEQLRRFVSLKKNYIPPDCLAEKLELEFVIFMVIKQERLLPNCFLCVCCRTGTGSIFLKFIYWQDRDRLEIRVALATRPTVVSHSQ